MDTVFCYFISLEEINVSKHIWVLKHFYLLTLLEIFKVTNLLRICQNMPAHKSPSFNDYPTKLFKLCLRYTITERGSKYKAAIYIPMSALKKFYLVNLNLALFLMAKNRVENLLNYMYI